MFLDTKPVYDDKMRDDLFAEEQFLDKFSTSVKNTKCNFEE